MLHSLITILPMTTCLFWLTGFMIGWRKTYPAQHVLMFFFLTSTLLYAGHWLYFSGIRSPWWETIYAVSNLLVYPLFMLYLIRLSGVKMDRIWWLFVPSAIILIVYPLCFCLGWSNTQQYFYIFARACFTIQMIYVWISGSRRIRLLREKLDDYFTDDRSASLHALNVLLWLFGSIAIFSTIWNILGRERFNQNDWLAFPSMLMTILLYALGYVGFVLRDPFFGMSSDNSQKDASPVGNNHIENEESAALVEKLEALIKTDKPYLRADLTIMDVSAMVGTNRTYLSATINRVYGVNFSTYINQLRVEHAKQILSDEQYTQDKQAISDAIAMSGFLSEQTFYRVFKEQTGQTPLQYRLAKRMPSA